jgi:hypothetical protein
MIIVRTRTATAWLQALLPMLACVSSLASNAADAGRQQPQAQSQAQAQKKVDELSEVLVEATRQRTRRPGFREYEQDFNWLARMVGTFVIDGRVDLGPRNPDGNPGTVTGRAVCVGFGVAPGVQCELRMRWPGSSGASAEIAGLANLDPASALFGFDLAKSGVSYILVDNKGTAETAVGMMVTSDTMQSRARCGAIAGNCERVSRFTAHPDLKTVDLHMDVEVDDSRVASFALVMHRVPGRPAVVYGREQKDSKKVRK